MFRMLESQAPAKQNATDTINVLSGRLQSATLVEDRRAAILGLRSFAKIYPASVASGALKNLIACLNRDGEDVDTTKVVLETLLMLFNPDESSPEASDDIALWLADEFSQHQGNITILLELLDRPEFFSRLYSLQLLSAISIARPERTQECVFTAPLGVSRLVAILDDTREAVRTEGLLLLTALTLASQDLQKLVAFENAFDRIFEIIDAEGSLTNGGVVVQDCLSLMANLLRLNVSNQSFFRETGGVTKIAGILEKTIREQDSADGATEWAASQRNKNLWGLLSVIRLFLLGGSIGSKANQGSFWQNGVVFKVLVIAFHNSNDSVIRAEALLTCADLIRGNSNLQERFAQREVASTIDDVIPVISKTNGYAVQRAVVSINVIQGLLDLALSVSSNNALEVRLAACECLKAYIHGHGPIRLHFLRRARAGHLSETIETDNILTILLKEPNHRRSADPYHQWVAAVLLFHLLYEDYDAKKLTREITEGDADRGEEVVTCIQALTGKLISGALGGDDDKSSVGYLMVLSGWLFEDPDAVNDFLGEGSSVQSLIHLAMQQNQQKILVAGLCAFLLGITYEFSSKDSPIPRAMLHEILTTRLGREQYYDKLTKLREHPLIRDFEVTSHAYVSSQNRAFREVYFDKTFVDFLKDNYSRVFRAIDRDPGIEISVLANGIQKGISRELVDSLKSQLETRSQALQKAESELLDLERRLGQEQADHRKAKESAAIEISRIKNINGSLHKNHDTELQKKEEMIRKALFESRRIQESLLSNMRADVEKQREENEATELRFRSRADEEIKDLKSTITSLKLELEKSNRGHAQDLRTANEEYSVNMEALKLRLKRIENEADDAKKRVTSAYEAAKTAEEARSTIQTELDDLFMILDDLEEKRMKDKQRLKELGDPISDAEGEGDTDGAT